MNQQHLSYLFWLLFLFLAFVLIPGCSCDEDSSAEALAKADDDLPAVASAKVGDDLPAIASAEVDDDDDSGPNGFYWKEDVYVQYVDGGEPGESGTSVEIGADGTLYVLAEKGGAVVLYTKEPGASAWKQTYLDYIAFDCAMAMDEDGYLHVAVGAEDPADDTQPGGWGRTTQLKYLTNKSGEWETTIVDVDKIIAGYVAIDTDIDGAANIVYLDNSNNDLKYATNKSGQWTTEAIFTSEEMGYDVGQSPSIALDGDGFVHVTFQPAISGFSEHGLHYGTNKSGTWEYELISGDSLAGDIAVDDTGFVHISRPRLMDGSNNYNLYYTTNRSGNWVSELVSNNETVGWDSSIAIDQNGAIHLGFHSYVPGNTAGYATNKDGFWDVTLILDEQWNGNSTSIALDQLTVPYIVHSQHSNGKLKFSTPASGDWTTEIIDSTGYSYGLLDGVNTTRKYILFDQDKIGVNSFMLAEIGDEEIWNINELNASNYDGYFSFVVDDDGFVHIIYYSGGLVYMTNASNQWNTTSIRNYVEDSGFSIDVDHNGNMHISFIDEGLWYMTNISGHWEETFIDDNAFRFPYNVIGSNGDAHICYVNKDVELNYATNKNGTWEITKIDNERNYSCRMALASDDSIRIFNYNSIDEKLYYNTNQNGNWERTAISDVLASYDICVDSQDQVSAVNDCKYFHLDSGQWIESENCILSRGYRQGFISIQVDDNDMAHGLINYRGGLWYVAFPRDYQ